MLGEGNLHDDQLVSLLAFIFIDEIIYFMYLQSMLYCNIHDYPFI